MLESVRQFALQLLVDEREWEMAERRHGALARHAGDHGRAAALLAERLTLYRTLGATLSVTECLEELAALALSVARPLASARLGGAADALRKLTGAPAEPMERTVVEATDAAAPRRSVMKHSPRLVWLDRRLYWTLPSSRRSMSRQQV
jgi:hypothetical protein